MNLAMVTHQKLRNFSYGSLLVVENLLFHLLRPKFLHPVWNVAKWIKYQLKGPNVGKQKQRDRSQDSHFSGSNTWHTCGSHLEVVVAHNAHVK